MFVHCLLLLIEESCNSGNATIVISSSAAEGFYKRLLFSSVIGPGSSAREHVTVSGVVGCLQTKPQGSSLAAF